MLNFALDAITSFSEKPLSLTIYFGFFITSLSILAIVYLILTKFFHPETVIQDWTSVMVMILFFGGVQLISVGVLGQYIGRIFRQTKGRPLYIVDNNKSKLSSPKNK